MCLECIALRLFTITNLTVCFRLWCVTLRVIEKAEAMGKAGLVEITEKQDTFIFKVESNGALRASQLVLNALEILRKKLQAVRLLEDDQFAELAADMQGG